MATLTGSGKVLQSSGSGAGIDVNPTSTIVPAGFARISGITRVSSIQRISQLVRIGTVPPVPPPITPTYWWDPAFDRRQVFSLSNSTGSDLHDQVLSITPDADVNTASLRLIEITPLGSVDRAFDWRYAATSSTDQNHLPLLPASLSGGVITFKALGRWASSETRTFALYWQHVPTAVAPTFSHLDARLGVWTALAVAGSDGDTYRLVVNGNNYDYVQQPGDTATLIATGLKNAINLGSDATATSSTGTVSISRASLTNYTFTVTNTGSTTPGNLTVTKPVLWLLGRVGPDTANYTPASYPFGLPYGASASGVVSNRVAFGRSTSEAVRLMNYRVNGDGTAYGASDGTVSSLTQKGHTLDLAGALTFSTRSAGVDWAAAYTATYQHRFLVGRKSDNTGANTLVKYVDAIRVTLVYTCQPRLAISA